MRTIPNPTSLLRAVAAAAVALIMILPATASAEPSPPYRPAFGLDVGFNGRVEQIESIDHFYGPGRIRGPRLCQYYTGWDTAMPDEDGNPRHPSGWAANTAWLENAQASGCDEVLISFKALSSADLPEEFDPVPPTPEEYREAFAVYADTDWESLTGYDGEFSFAAWNEPNLNATAGNGYPSPTPGAPSVIGPRLAAQYYLAARSECEARGCSVAAVNFGSNGGTWVDYKTNCATAEVPRDELCAEPGEHNPDGEGPSYLDQYRNEIHNAASDFGLPEGFRPEVVAYHGWADTNAYLYGSRYCSGYDDCLLDRVLYAFSGSWGEAEIWNTEDGVGQPGFFSHEEMTDERQTDGMAYMLSLAEASPRYTRLYYTHMVGSPSRLLLPDGEDVIERPAMKLLQRAAVGS